MLSVILKSRFYLCVLQRSFGRGAQRPGCTEPPCPTPQQPRRARTTPTLAEATPPQGLPAAGWEQVSWMAPRTRREESLAGHRDSAASVMLGQPSCRSENRPHLAAQEDVCRAPVWGRHYRRALFAVPRRGDRTVLAVSLILIQDCVCSESVSARG